MTRLNQNLIELIEGTKKIWARLASNVVKINGQQKNINGNVGMLFAADGVTPIEKTILRAYLNTTASIAGCQQIRKKNRCMLLWVPRRPRRMHLRNREPEPTSFFHGSQVVARSSWGRRFNCQGCYFAGTT